MKEEVRETTFKLSLQDSGETGFIHNMRDEL